MLAVIGCIGCGCFGFLIAALFNAQSYDKGFDDGFADGIRAAQRMEDENDDQ